MTGFFYFCSIDKWDIFRYLYVNWAFNGIIIFFFLKLKSKKHAKLYFFICLLLNLHSNPLLEFPFNGWTGKTRITSHFINKWKVIGDALCRVSNHTQTQTETRQEFSDFLPRQVFINSANPPFLLVFMPCWPLRSRRWIWEKLADGGQKKVRTFHPDHPPSSQPLSVFFPPLIIRQVRHATTW